MNANQKNRLAADIFGGPRVDALQRVSATAVTDSADGLVTIEFDDGSQIEVDTLGSVESGDTVLVDVQNGHTVVSGATGWGDRLYEGVDGLQTLVHEYSGGVLVAKVGQAVGALVNADGSFDVVAVTWSGTTPTVGGDVATFGKSGIVFSTYADNRNRGETTISPDGAIESLGYRNGFAYQVKMTGHDISLVENNYTMLEADYYTFRYNNDSNVAFAKITGDPAIYYRGVDANSNPADVGLPLFKIVNISYTTASLAVNNGVSGNLSLASSVPDGYTAIGIVGVQSTHGQNWYDNSYVRVDTQTLYYNIKHAFGSSAETCTFTFKLLCVPSGNYS